MVSLTTAIDIVEGVLDHTTPEQRTAPAVAALAAGGPAGAPLAVPLLLDFHESTGLDPTDYDDPRDYADDVIAEFDLVGEQEVTEIVRHLEATGCLE